MTGDRTHLRTALRALAVMAIVFAASIVGIVSRPEHLLATVWPTNALLLGILIRRPGLARHPLAWLGALSGYLAADVAGGSPMPMALLLASANLAGVVAGLWMAQVLEIRHTAFSHPTGVLRLFLACACASLCAGLVGTIAGRVLLGMPSGDAFGYWVSAELVCYLSILPVVLLLPPAATLRSLPAEARSWLQLRHRRPVPLLLLVLSVVAASWMGGAGAIMLPVPALLWCALTYRMFGTSLITLALSLWTLVAIGYGFMPLHSALSETHETISLRIGVAFLAVAPLTVAVVNAARDRLLTALEHAASHDSLTRVLNRDAFFGRTCGQLDALARNARPAALILLDVDHFKRVNDVHGHASGDLVLATFAQRLQDAMRSGDLLGRFGGEEFIIFLPDTAPEAAAGVADQLRALASVEPILLDDGTPLTITASLGCASVAALDGTHGVEPMLQAADVALYQAKSMGRDRVVQARLD